MREAESSARRLERVVAAQAVVAEVSRAVGPALELDATVKLVLDAMRDLVDFRGGSVCIVENGQIRMAACDPPASDEVLALRLPVGSGIAGRVVESGTTLYVPDLDEDDRVDDDIRQTGSNAGMVSYLCVPLICLGQTVGLLQVDSGERDAFDDVDAMVLEGLAGQMASAIESARLIEEMTRVDEMKRGFVSLVSHELRTPLTIASGMLDSYRRVYPAPDEDGDRLLDRAGAALTRLGRLIEELITMSQLSAGELRGRPAQVEVSSVLDEVVRACPAPERVRVRCPEHLVIETDADLLRRALSALVENAVVYADDVELVADAEVIVVRDQGPGLPAEVLDRITEPFERLASNDTTIAGLGLGLTLARALITELGGSLELVSEPGTGTEVRVVLDSA